MKNQFKILAISIILFSFVLISCDMSDAYKYDIKVYLINTENYTSMQTFKLIFIRTNPYTGVCYIKVYQSQNFRIIMRLKRMYY